MLFVASDCIFFYGASQLVWIFTRLTFGVASSRQCRKVMSAVVMTNSQSGPVTFIEVLETCRYTAKFKKYKLLIRNLLFTVPEAY